MENIEIKTTQSSLPSVENLSRSAEVSRSSEGVRVGMQPDKLETQEVTTSDLTNIVASVNEYIKVFSTKVSFGYDFENERQVILVKDNETGEIIRQIPPKEMINLLKQLEKITGIIYHNHI
tara:strand:+ start:2402 stop:2764 length:363 start_codon:yes stop_codon:yes gene_type:complete